MGKKRELKSYHTLSRRQKQRRVQAFLDRNDEEDQHAAHPALDIDSDDSSTDNTTLYLEHVSSDCLNSSPSPPVSSHRSPRARELGISTSARDPLAFHTPAEFSSLLDAEEPYDGPATADRTAVEKLLSSIEKEQAALGRQIKKTLAVGLENNTLLRELHEKVQQMKKKQPAQDFVEIPTEPASTLQELADLLSNEGIIETLRRYEASTLKATLRAMLKRLMTRALAVTFSFTGLDGKRMRTKTSLKGHSVYQVLLGAIECTAFAGAPRQEVDRILKGVLKNVGDWENYRGIRKKKVEELQRQEAGVTAGLDGLASTQASCQDQSWSAVTSQGPYHEQQDGSYVVSSYGLLECGEIYSDNLQN
ncbi:uncharacterized protein LOC108666209 [Hyalella azteca]|uniref:Uncharacterized protein LOC108666209 n=1 Tax=Hyalella azteca TaxID=294128 RepID=A0A8B7N3W0_HYAAZ|nr:uncharacterized protein LOC108666209 [Hyalella azteca]